ASSTAYRASRPRSSRSLRRVTLPRVMRDTSSRSSTRRVRCCTCRSIMSRAVWRLASAGRSMRMTWAAERIGARGLCSSWASVAPQGGDEDVGPVRPSALADAPALLHVAPLGSRPPQLLGGPAPVDGVGGVEEREVPADDLLGPVAGDALGAGVPGRDAAVRV